MGVAKMRPSKSKLQISCIQRFRAWMTSWVASSSVASRSSSRLASVGHIIERSMPSSSMSTSRGSGSKKAGMERIGLTRPDASFSGAIGGALSLFSNIESAFLARK